MHDSRGFSQDAIAVLRCARAAAVATRSRGVDAAHVLCGLLDHESSHEWRSRLLEGGSAPGLRRAAHGATTRQRRHFLPWPTGLPYARSGKRAVESALKWSRTLGSPSVLPVHILLALLDENSPDTSRLLQAHGIALEQVLAFARATVSTIDDHAVARGTSLGGETSVVRPDDLDFTPPSELAATAVFLIFELRDGSVKARRFESVRDAREFLER